VSDVVGVGELELEAEGRRRAAAVVEPERADTFTGGYPIVVIRDDALQWWKSYGRTSALLSRSTGDVASVPVREVWIKHVIRSSFTVQMTKYSPIAHDRTSSQHSLVK
jgi:hypothetical protein